MKSHILLYPEMGLKIIKHLSQFCELPSVGYVAGQSVASALFDVFGNGDGQVYNDVDVFYSPTHEENSVLYSRKVIDGLAEKLKLTSTFTHNQWAVDVDAYGVMHCTEAQRYKVLSTYRKGMLNLVACSFMQLEFFKKYSFSELAQTEIFSLLDSFDLNCVQVGVDLSSGRMYWTPAFFEFVQSRQLRISRLHTPYHTAIRWFKKKEELLNCFGNDDQAMELVTWAAFNYDKQQQHSWQDSRWRFGYKMKDLYSEHASAISPYFELEKRGSLFLLKPRHEASKELTSFLDPFSSSMNSSSMAANLFFSGSKAVISKVNSIKQIVEEDSRYYPLLQLVAMQGLPFLEGQKASVAQLVKAIKFSALEHGFYPWLMRYKADALTQSVSNLKRISKSQGLWTLGYLEKNIGIPQESGVDLNMAAISLSDEIKSVDLFKKLKVQLAGPLVVNRAPIKFRFGKYTVTELNTALDLFKEGDRMRHCVGGYCRAVAEERSRIFSVDYAGSELSTIELVNQASAESPKWMATQYRAKFNKVPESYSTLLLELVVSIANENSTEMTISALLTAIYAQGTQVLLDKTYKWRIFFRYKILSKIKLRKKNTRQVFSFEDMTDDIPF